MPPAGIFGARRSCGGHFVSGVLYGVGLGPGDPELMTLRAHRLISGAKVVAYPALAGAESFARSIAAGAMAPGVREIVMDVPMTTERGPAQAAYDVGAGEIAAVLEAGEDVVCLCEGDPFFYGSFMHLYTRLTHLVDVQVLPAITGMSGAWTATGAPITWGDDVLTVLMGTLEEKDLVRHMDDTDALVVMKIGRNFDKVVRALKVAGKFDDAWIVQFATMPNQSVTKLSEMTEDVTPYFSIIVVHGQGRRP